MLSLALLSLLALVVAWVARWIYNWNYPACNGKLPPGSMGLPIIGETLQLLKPQTTFDVPPFVKDRMRRYGSLFKTNLLGQKTVVSTDPNFFRFLLLQDGVSVELGHLGSAYKKLIGESTWPWSTGVLHKYLRSMIRDHLNPLRQKDLILSEMKEIVLRHLDTWSMQDSVDLKQVTSKMSFEIALVKLLNRDATKHLDSFIDKFTSLFQGLLSLPFDIPGFHFHKCLKNRREVIRIIKDSVKQGLFSTEKHDDFLNAVVQDMKKEEPVFNIDSAAQFIFVLLFAAFDTVSTAIPLAIKFISEDASILKELQDEHEALLRNKSDVDSTLTWKDYTSMTFTSHVIDETLRLANIAPLIIRQALKDIHTDEGYIIPAGWLILLCPPTLHFNPVKYQDPFAFNPWRWKGHGSNFASKDFGAFGGGVRLCPGAEFSKLQISIVLHFLVTKYRWTKIKGGDISWNPMIAFPNGLHLNVTKEP